MTYTYKVKIPEIFGEKRYHSIFIGYEDKAGLVRRKDIEYTDKFIFETFDKEIEQIIFLGHDGNDWDNIREVILGNKCLVNEYDDIILPICDNDKNIEVHCSEFNKRVTIVFIDENHDDQIKKIIYMYNCIGLTNIKVINSKTVDMDPITSLDDYDNFVVKELYKYVDTEFCLISQWDGFIINYNRIKRDFFNYDYVDAPFYKNSSAEIGNGGFCLRSKKFLQISAELFKDKEIDEQDYLFYQSNITKLKQAGLRFSPWYIKDAFSIENVPYGGQFGFHSWRTRGLPDQAKQFYKHKFHHSGDLGDLIFGLPTMKALGGGILYISNDIQYFQKRSVFSPQLIKELRQFLRHQDYITEVYSEQRMPCDVDYDLNKFRRRQLLHYTGQLSEEEAEHFEKIWKYTTITKLHLSEFNCDLNADIEPWLKWDKKTVYENKLIIINRTARYQNPNFPWKEICKKYGEYIYFVGTSQEYKEFKNDVGVVDYLPTPTIVSLVEALLGSKLIIGNMSFPTALAEGFKHNCLVESGVDVRSNNYERHNIYVPNPDNIKVDKVLDYIKEYVGF